jgi:hypothetical protein
MLPVFRVNNCLSLATEELAVVLDLDTPAIVSMVREGTMEEWGAYKDQIKSNQQTFYFNFLNWVHTG